jgi:hypothetical protein
MSICECTCVIASVGTVGRHYLCTSYSIDRRSRSTINTIMHTIPYAHDLEILLAISRKLNKNFLLDRILFEPVAKDTNFNHHTRTKQQDTNEVKRRTT